NKFYADGHAIYVDKMKGVIGAVADVVERELNRATDRIAKGREDVKTYVEKLPKDQREFGRDAMEKVSAQFDSLEEEVKSKGDDLVQTVAQKYKEADAAVNARIEEMKAENSGF